MMLIYRPKKGCPEGASNPRLLVHIHVFYPAIWPELADCVDNFAVVVGWDRLDVRVTVSEVHQEALEHVRKRLPQAEIEVVENRGYDVAPFLKILDDVNLDDYDYVVKLHTKRDVDCWINFRKLQGADWRHELLSFCASESSVRRTLARLSKRPKLGMIAGSGVIDPSGVASPSQDDKADTVRLLREIGLHPVGRTFVWGTIFIARANVFKVLQGKFEQARFDPIVDIDNHDDHGLAGHIEQLFSMLVTAQGYYIGPGLFPDGIAIFLNWLNGIAFCWIRHLSNLARRVN